MNKPQLIFDIAIFDPNEESLQQIVNQVKEVNADPTKITKDELALVHETEQKLVKARISIKKIGKEVRDEAIKFQKDVIAYEKKLVGIIEPEELRLKDIKQEARTYALREQRKDTLPLYKERLESIGDDVQITDDQLLDMDPTQFEVYYTERLRVKLEFDKFKMEEAEQARKVEEERKQREAELAEQHAKDIKEAEARAKQQAELEHQQRLDAQEAARLKAEEVERKEQQQKLAEEAVRKEKQLQEKAFQEFLSVNSYDKNTDELTANGDGTTSLWREIAIYSPKK